MGRQPKESLAKLPSTSPDLFGREKDLNALSAAWDSPATNIVSLVAFGGVGKTALVNNWLLQMRQDDYREADRVYGWSFYSQGAAEGRQTSADLFIAAALEWFGDPNPTKGSPWHKGERLAELIRGQRTLLVLDGLEPLQYPPGEMEGCLNDPGLRSLLRELAHHNPGLCIVTTRLPVDDLKDFVNTSVKNIDLEHLSPEAGAKLLEHLGAKGTVDELKEAAEEFEGHALALTLLGRYLAAVHDGEVRERDKIEKLMAEPRQGGHARRVMESYARWFADKPELNILLMMALFDCPAEAGAIDAVRADPPIVGLTSALSRLSEAQWRFALSDLRAARLLDNAQDTLDCHPLVREHFCEKLKKNTLDAWKEAHRRLYRYYKSQAREFPDTVEGMAPLYRAVAHGCQAGVHQEILDEVYSQRIARKNEFFSTQKLGELGTDLAALSGFFEVPWQKPVTGLTRESKAFVLGLVGFRLQALGRLAEAIQPMKLALEIQIAEENWTNAAIDAGNLSEIHLPLGNLLCALSYARQAVDLADRNNKIKENHTSRRGRCAGTTYHQLSPTEMRTLERIVMRTTLGDVLHQVGSSRKAESAFRQAEHIQKEFQQQYPILHFLWGFRYCDLLVAQGKYRDVQNRASQTIKEAEQGSWLLDIALDYLSLGRAHLLQAQLEDTDDFTRATDYLNCAVDHFQQAGQQDYLPRGLLARAELYRVQGRNERAQQDLDQAMTIATRGGMRLHEADCHLEYTRLHLAMAEKDKARESLIIAKKMIKEMEYHRRDPEILLETAHLQILEGQIDEARQTLNAAKKRIDEMGCHRWDWQVRELEKKL